MIPTIHASAVLVGCRAVLIRGTAGSGKSRLAVRLLTASSTAAGFTRLVADDRTAVENVNGRLLVRPAPELAGLIEVRGLGIRRCPYEPVAIVGLVVDLADPEAERLPSVTSTTIAGVALPRLALPPAVDPFPPVMAALRTSAM